MIASVTVLGLALRFGAADVPCGGIANVCTLPAYRRRGASTALLGAALAFVRRAGWPLAALATGVPGHYARHGFAPWRRFTRRFFTLPPPAPSAVGGVRALDPVRDRRELVRLHALAAAGTPGALARSTAFWERHWAWTALHPRERPELGLAAGGGGSALAAYVRGAYDPDTGWARVIDFGAADGTEEAVARLAAALAAAAVRLVARGCAVPEAAGGLVRALEPLARAHAPEADDSMMLACLDPVGFLSALAPELSARAAAARAPDGAVRVEQGERAAVLAARNGVVAARAAGPADALLPRARLDPARWNEVFMGARLFSAQPFAATSRLGERELNLLDALFPPRVSCFWDADAF